MIRSLRLRFWLFVMDALCWLGVSGGRLWVFALERASDATYWGEGCDCGEGEPF